MSTLKVLIAGMGYPGSRFLSALRTLDHVPGSDV